MVRRGFQRVCVVKKVKIVMERGEESILNPLNLS
jgi:hypothetical protein